MPNLEKHFYEGANIQRDERYIQKSWQSRVGPWLRGGLPAAISKVCTLAGCVEDWVKGVGGVKWGEARSGEPGSGLEKRGQGLLLVVEIGKSVQLFAGCAQASRAKSDCGKIVEKTAIDGKEVCRSKKCGKITKIMEMQIDLPHGRLYFSQRYNSSKMQGGKDVKSVETHLGFPPGLLSPR